jgi:hypothetical protein
MYISEHEVEIFGNFIATLNKFGITVQIKCTMIPQLVNTGSHKVYEVTRRNNES